MAITSGVRSVLQQAGLWSFLGFAAIAAYNTVGSRVFDLEIEKYAAQKNTATKHGLVAISADRSGHFAVSALINGTHVEMLADTGATAIALTYEDALRLGMNLKTLQFDIPVRTANGVSRSAEVTLNEVRVGNIRVNNVRALVSPQGALSTNLLGMSFIKRLRSFQLKGRQLILQQ